MQIGALWGLFVQTYKVSIRSKWLIMFTIVFFFFAFNLPFLSLQLLGILPANYVSTFIGTLITTSFALMPLLALPLGAVSIVEEREAGSLQYILSTPTSRVMFLAARAAGLFAATSSIIILGFGLAAIFGLQFLRRFGRPALRNHRGHSPKRERRRDLSRHLDGNEEEVDCAQPGDPHLVPLHLCRRVGGRRACPRDHSQYSSLLPWIVLNPVEMSRLIAVLQIPSGIQDLGATGEAVKALFQSNAVNVMLGTMGLWIGISLAAAFVIFSFQDIA